MRIWLTCRPRTPSKGHVLSLSPLAGPETAIAFEAQIDLWSALVVPNLLFSFRTPSRCCTITPVSGLQPVGELFLLTSPFIDQVNGRKSGGGWSDAD